MKLARHFLLMPLSPQQQLPSEDKSVEEEEEVPFDERPGPKRRGGHRCDFVTLQGVHHLQPPLLPWLPEPVPPFLPSLSGPVTQTTVQHLSEDDFSSSRTDQTPPKQIVVPCNAQITNPGKNEHEDDEEEACLWDTFGIASRKPWLVDESRPVSAVSTKVKTPWVDNDAASLSRFLDLTPATLIGNPTLQLYRMQVLPELVQSLFGPLLTATVGYVQTEKSGWTANTGHVIVSDFDTGNDLCHPITDFVLSTASFLFRKCVLMDRNQPHVARHDSRSETVSLHHDEGDLTVQIMLHANDNVGGGTYFPSLGRRVVLSRGEALVHPGKLTHQSCPTEEGARFTLIYFLNFV